MKKRDRLVEVADLEAVAHLGEDIVLFIDSEDENLPTSFCVQANFDTQQFSPVQRMSVFLDLNNYQLIQDPDTRISYRQRILEEMDPDVIIPMLYDFTQKLGLNVEKPSFLNDKRWYPGG
ncbi:MAG: hypothetical protein AB9842_05545 [Bacteroidales bacterium]